MATNSQKLTNSQYFENAFKWINEGGFYMWKEKGFAYYKKDGKMVADTMEGWTAIKIITPKGWAKKNIKLKNTPVKVEENEVTRLKKELKFEKEQGTIALHQVQSLLAENSKLKRQFELIEQSTESSAYSEEILANYRNVMNEIDTLEPDHFEHTIDEIVPYIKGLKAEIEKLNIEVDMLRECQICGEGGYEKIGESQGCESCSEEIYSEEIDKQEEKEKQEAKAKRMLNKLLDDSQKWVHFPKKDVKVGEGDVGWEKY